MNISTNSFPPLYNENASSLSINSSSSPPAECLLAQSFALDSQANVLRSVQILMVFIFFALLIRLIRVYFMETVIFHGNFLLLFSNIVLVYLIYACACFLQEFRYLLLYFISGPLNLSPCSSMTPIWWSAIVHVPKFFESFFMPLIHFTLMLERVRATLFMDQYEREGLHFGLISLLSIWLFSILYALFIFLSMLMENEWNLSKKFSFTSLSSSNNWVIIAILYAILAIIFVTILADLLIVFRNKKAQKQMINSSRYNLSRIYQINENILTMRGLILPLDFCFYTLFLIYFSVAIFLRTNQLSISKINFQIGHIWINSVMLLHGIITVFLYIKFLINSRKRRKRAPEIKPNDQQMEAYFGELRKQWNK